MQRDVALAGSQAPLYVRLKEVLGRILDEGMRPGDRFPSESELETQYGVSRTTVRLALGALADEGRIVRRQGRGNLVAEPKRTIGEFGLLTGGKDNASSTSTIRIISLEQAGSDAHRALLLGTAPDEALYRIRRLHLIDDVPVCYQVSYLPARAFVLVPTAEHIAETALDQTSVIVADEISGGSIEIVLADAYRSQLLGVLAGSPLLLLEKMGLADGVPIELSRSFYAGHAVRIEGTHNS